MPTAEVSTETLTLTVPKKFMARIRESAAEAGFAEVSKYVESLLVSETLFEPIDSAELVHWMNTEGARRLEELHADPSSGLTLDQAFEGLIDDEEA